MPTLELLAGLGLPSAAVGLILLGWILKVSHPKSSTCSFITGLAFLVTFGAIQLYQLVTGADVIISDPPPNAFVLDSGGPVQLDITVSRGDEILATKTIPALSSTNFDRTLRNMEWTPAAESTLRCFQPR